MEDPVVRLERNLFGHPLAGLLWERQLEKVPLKHGWEKVPIGKNACLSTGKKDYSYLCMVDDMKLAGKKENLSPKWKIQMQDVDLGEPTSFLDHAYLGYIQRECQISKWLITRVCLNLELLLVQWKSYQKPKLQGTLETNTISSWSCDMEGHAKKCVDRYCELANKTTEQLF